MSDYPKFVYEDRDLFPVLKKATDQELGMLADTFCTKWSCDLEPTCRDVPAIVNEFQRMGGNTIANVWRGYGVDYAEIVDDVAGQVGAEVDETQTIEEKEWRILEHLVESAEEKMEPEERKAFYEELRKQSGNQDFTSVKELLLHQASFHAVRLIIFHVVTRQLLLRIGVSSAAGLIGGRVVSLLCGPVGWVLGSIWAVIDIAGPAYSVTIPGVMIVGSIRARLAAEDAASEIGGPE